MITPSFNNLTIKTTLTRRSQTNGDCRGRMGCTVRFHYFFFSYSTN